MDDKLEPTQWDETINVVIYDLSLPGDSDSIEGNSQNF